MGQTTNIADQPATKAANSAPVLRSAQLSFAYPTTAGPRPVLGDISFDVAEGEFVSLVGPSGVGKTTLLRVLCGLMPPTSGSVAIRGNAVTQPPRELAVVFQDYSRSLLPWMSIVKNVALPLVAAKVPRAECAKRVDEALGAVGLTDHGHKYPWQLSGGMQQRVAIARALAYKPEILVMDEPFASVDAQTRFDLEDLVLKIRSEYGVTVLLVTHDIDEAVYLSDQVVVLGGAPASVKNVVKIDLGTERDQIATKSLPLFTSLRGTVLSEVRAVAAATRGGASA